MTSGDGTRVCMQIGVDSSPGHLLQELQRQLPLSSRRARADAPAVAEVVGSHASPPTHHALQQGHGPLPLATLLARPDSCTVAERVGFRPRLVAPHAVQDTQGFLPPTRPLARADGGAAMELVDLQALSSQVLERGDGQIPAPALAQDAEHLRPSLGVQRREALQGRPDVVGRGTFRQGRELVRDIAGPLKSVALRTGPSVAVALGFRRHGCWRQKRARAGDTRGSVGPSGAD
mmetsp:Transcript_100818/g.323542  ORF Transcript_100818/g.323542 Transcript_100818/m.323542 type:complete len:233 (-) Transcript_100818:7-705(-)